MHLLLADQSPSDGAGSNCGCANVMGGIAAVGLFLFPCQKVKKNNNTTPNYGSPIRNKQKYNKARCYL